MKKILLVMYRKVLAEALVSDLRANTAFSLRVEYRYESAPISADVFQPDVVLMEIPESGKNTPEKCLLLCDALRKKQPACKTLLLTPEGNEEACSLTIQAAREGRISDFVYYDTSIRYLISKLEAL